MLAHVEGVMHNVYALSESLGIPHQRPRAAGGRDGAAAKNDVLAVNGFLLAAPVDLNAAGPFTFKYYAGCVRE